MLTFLYGINWTISEKKRGYQDSYFIGLYKKVVDNCFRVMMIVFIGHKV